jgi:hypothetical protein
MHAVASLLSSSNARSQLIGDRSKIANFNGNIVRMSKPDRPSTVKSKSSGT